MTNDIRAALERLVSEIKESGHWLAHTDAFAASRAALAAEVVGKGPSDDELLKTYCDARRAFYFEAAEGESDQEDRKAAAVAGLRAVLAHLGLPSTPPAPEPGEVGEVVEALHRICLDVAPRDADTITRAATLLQQLSAPAPAVVPVAVNEQPWDRKGWCDAEKRCWFLKGNHWILDYPLRLPVEIFAQIYSLSLPAHAIPLPQRGEGDQ